MSPSSPPADVLGVPPPFGRAPSDLVARRSAEDIREYADEIDATLRHGFRWQRFPSRLEALFELETENSRRAQLFYDGIVAIVVYVAFLLSDFYMIPDVMKTAVIVRLGVVTPLALLKLLILWWGVRPAIRELMEMGIFICAGISVIYLVAISSHPNSAFFHNMVVLVIVYANGVVRLRFWHALTASLSILFVYLAAIPLNSVPPPFGVQFNYIAVIGSAILFTLFANYSLERSERLNYLHDLRDRIHRAELAASNARLKELSHLDPLTGIPNRRDMDVHLEQLCRSPEALPLSVVMIDVDRFKLYNDRYGHQAGDECLRRIASILQASLRYTYDRVARYGGEEFAVVLPKTNPSQAVEVAERMRKAVLGLMIPHQDSTYGAVVTISAGVAAFTAPGDPASILAMADQALYAAKDSGGNRVVSLTAGNGNPADPYESAA